jgi:GT2 family glycosyltransferase
VIALVVPVYKNFAGFANLMSAVDHEIYPIIIPNWGDNIGVSRGWNAGLKKALDIGADVTIISNDDAAPFAGTFQKLADNVGSFDLLSATNYKDSSEIHDGPEFDGHPDFSMFAVSTNDFVEKFGFFDENFSPAYFEDNDMARRILVAGGSYARMLSAGMFHEGSVTQNMDGPVVTSEMFERNRAYYTRKWGGWPMSETYTHPFNDPNKTIKDW